MVRDGVALGALALLLGTLLPTLIGVGTAAASGKASLDVCVIEPGLGSSGAQYGLTTQGPKGFNDTATLAGSSCGSYKQLPAAGKYAVTQSQTPSGWHLAQIYCYSVGSAENAQGSVNGTSVSVSVNGPTTCLFAELAGGGGGSTSGGFSGGTGSSSSSSGHGSTTTTTKSGGSTTTTAPVSGGVSYCKAHPEFCIHLPVTKIT